MDLPELYKKQISLSEWFDTVDFKVAEKFRKEDNSKRDRMDDVSKIIDFPFDKPTSFLLSDVVDRQNNFLEFEKEKGEELCALRLIPKKDGLPKLRMRGMSIYDVVNEWLPKQKVIPKDYKANFVPHPSGNMWSSIIVVDDKGIVGEIVKGSHNQLTQGFYDNGVRPYEFFYDFEKIKIDNYDKDVEEHIKKILSYLLVEDLQKQKILKEKLNSKFSHNFLCGYFETVESVEYGLWFIDYNRVLGKNFKNLNLNFDKDIDIINNNNLLIGTMASPGEVIGKVNIIDINDIGKKEFANGDILVCNMTTPEYIPLMKKAGAIITKEGGILSHAAIISRELGIPSIVGVGKIFDKIKNNDTIRVNANKGIINLI